MSYIVLLMSFQTIYSINYDRSKHTTQKQLNQTHEAETPDRPDPDNSER